MAQLIVPVRDEWTYQHQVNILLPRRPEFQPSIVLLKEQRPADWTTIDIACDRRRAALREQLPQFALEQSSTVVYLACPAVRLTYTWRADAGLLRQAMQLWLVDAEVYSATFTDLAAGFLETLPLFQGWLAEIGFQGAPP
ncbi:MAG TPA: DcrB-related protein [Kofleriaceae bacterium]|nr:DcrB-related protein [Kofleriaceae bacterium]